MYLKKSNFADVVKNTPLISIDLCIRKEDSLFLGKRLNSPAKDYFFVPGGRIRKNEKIEFALNRIMDEEIGCRPRKIEDFKFLGVYEHFYDDNFLNTEDFTTHYVVLAYLIDFRNLINFPSQINQIQHSEYIWYSPKKKNSVKVHSYTKNYFFNRNICEKS